MALYVASLNSGSNGNCYYIGTENEAILVDAGISCRETERRMQQLGLDMLKVKAIVVSHEHNDHIRGVAVLSKKYHLPVFITENTRINGRVSVRSTLQHSFTPEVPINIEGFSVKAFSKAHDAADPHSFVVSRNNVNVGVFTDIGTPCENLIQHFKQCHAAFLEANYDEQMLETGRYPYYLKTRIRGGKGHLSNTQALEVYKQHRPPFMSHLFLSHLSRDNNDPVLVKQMFDGHFEDTSVIIASRYGPTEVYQIKNPAMTNGV